VLRVSFCLWSGGYNKVSVWPMWGMCRKPQARVELRSTDPFGSRRFARVRSGQAYEGGCPYIKSSTIVGHTMSVIQTFS
jgi:hypothetical protein